MLLICSTAVIITSSQDVDPSGIIAEEASSLLQEDTIAVLQRAATAVRLSIVRATNQHSTSLDKHGRTHKSDQPVMPPLMRQHDVHDRAALLPKISQLRNQAPVDDIRHFAKEKRGKAKARIRAMHNRLQAIRRSMHKKLMKSSSSTDPLKKHYVKDSQQRATSRSNQHKRHTEVLDTGLQRLQGLTKQTPSKKLATGQKQHRLRLAEPHKATVFTTVMQALRTKAQPSKVHPDRRQPSRSGSIKFKDQRVNIRKHIKSSRVQPISDVVDEAMASANQFHAKENRWKKMLRHLTHTKLPKPPHL